MKKYTLSNDQLSFIERMRQPFAVYQFVDKKVVTIALSDGFCELFGYDDRAQAYYDMDHNMYKDTHPDDVARLANAAVHFASEGGKLEVIYRTRKKDSSGYIVLHLIGEHIYTDDGARLAHVWYTDEGEYIEGAGTGLNSLLNRALHEESIVKANRYDYLTGLPNMSYFFEIVEGAAKKLEAEGERPVLLYIDLAGMKYYNQKYGFAEGDKLLRALGKLLSRFFHTQSSCHIGADHFAVLEKEKGLEEKLHHFFEEWNSTGGKALPVHIGIFLSQREGLSVSSACDRAKIACDSLKGTYSSCFNYYSPELNDMIVKRNYVLDHFDRALSENWIQVWYQPIMRAISWHVCHDEALARWIDPEKGILPPSEFIPYLEDAGLAYKLDLYVLDRVLENIKTQMAENLYIVPHSINLSRSDFDSCDIVEEIRSRVDASGIGRDKICIEITESMIGRDFDFMKGRIERFQELGFPVWMDDFGSGYSSLDVLQSIKFDLIKFDMNFMRKLDENDDGRIILTELMKMTLALGIDTVCEGVETEEQSRFLQDIGCSKLQGYFFSRPASFEDLMGWHLEHRQNGYENPAESSYYETICSVNLYDLDVIAQEEKDSLQNTYNTLPMGIIEIRGTGTRFVRSNQSYRDFFRRFFALDLPTLETGFVEFDADFMKNVVSECCERGLRAFYDEKMPDGSVVHSLARRISTNPVTGNTAVAVAVLSISNPGEGETYVDIARALAADYYNIYVVDLDTDRFIEYSSPVGGQEMAVERHGENFFEADNHNSHHIYEGDLELFYAAFSKEKIIQALNEQGVFTLTYRLVDSGVPEYVNMKIMRMQTGTNRIIIGVSNIDTQMKQQEEEKKLRQERISLGRIAALSPNYIVLYTADPETGHYMQYNPSNEFESVGLAGQGEDFFRDVVLDAPKAIAPEDIERHLRVFTKDNILREIQENGFFLHSYRLLIAGKPVPVYLRATLIEENGRKMILIGIMKDDAEDHRHRLEIAYEKARDNRIIFTHIAQALARGYTDLFYVNMQTDELIEFHTDDESGVLTEARRGSDFFEGCERDAKIYIYPEDQAAFVKAMDRDFLMDALEKDQIFEMTYRRMQKGKPIYVRMRVTRIEEDQRYIVIAVSDVDELIRKRRAEEKIMEERVIYARLHAITGNFIVVYVIEPETGIYREFSSKPDYEGDFSQAKGGSDFFAALRKAVRVYSHPEDTKRVLSLLTKDNVMSEIERCGIFSLGYRIMKDGKPLHIQLKAAMVEEKEGTRLIVGINDIDAQFRQEEEFIKRLALAQSQANIDALTGVRNRHAFLEMEADLNRQIADHKQQPFSIAAFDVNDLKQINDTLGHHFGDQYLRDACRIICDIFKHSAVFRMGGDEFVVIAQGKDHEHIEERLRKLNEHNMAALQDGGIVIACGIAKYEDDPAVACMLERADRNMYQNKKDLKEGSFD